MEYRDVYGLVPDDEVEPLRHALRLADIPAHDIEVHDASPGRYRLHDERLRRDGHGAAGGLLVGVLAGAVLGLVVAASLPSVDLAGEIVSTVIAFAGLGGLVGAMSGLQRAEPHDDDPVQFREVGPEMSMAVVEVHNEHWALRAHRIMARHGVDFLDDPAPMTSA